MKEQEWYQLKRPYEVLADRDGEYGWHIFECHECEEILGFEQYPHDGKVLCIDCGLKKAP